MDKIEFTDPRLGQVSLERTFIEVLASEMDKFKGKLIQEYAEGFAEKHAEWLRIQEEMEAKYTWIPARELRDRTIICEQQGRGRKVLKYTVTERHQPESRFDRKVKVTVNKTKQWVYDPDDFVMVRRHG